jgi:3-phosphoshikimate 1-carboxyvinyltransferase
MYELLGPIYLSRPSQGLQGSLSVPGDKSISHRALMISALTAGRTNIYGVLEGEDVMKTADAMKAMGVVFSRFEHAGYGNHWEVDGLGVGGLTEPENILDMGNSGTGARLITAILASNKFVSVLTGDESLRARPMNRVTDPLSQNGVQFKSPKGLGFPLTILGTDEPLPIIYTCPVASAQVKSAMRYYNTRRPFISSISNCF